MAPILTNHIGYDCGDTKSAVYQRQSDETPASFRVICDKTGAVCFEGAPVETGEVDNWCWVSIPLTSACWRAKAAIILIISSKARPAISSSARAAS